MKTVNVALIGTGSIAINQHMPAWAKQTDAKIIAVCDANEEAAKQAAESFAIPYVFTDYKKLLEMDEVEAVDICTPNLFHMPLTIDALSAGKHVLVEKPIARNSIEGNYMVEAAKKSGKKLMVGHCLRYSAEAQFIKSAIDAGDLGDIYFSRVWALRRRGVPSWGVFTNKEKQGGGPLIDIGVHMIDLACFLMGHPKPTSVSGMAVTKIGNTPGHIGLYGSWDWQNYTVEDYAAAFVRFDNGSSMIVESSFAANIAEDIMNTMLLGTKAGAEYKPTRILGEAGGIITDVVPAHLPNVDFYEAEIRGFIDSIVNDTEPPITGEQAVSVMKILDAIYKSGELGREVTID